MNWLLPNLPIYFIIYGFIFRRTKTAEHFVQKAHKDYTFTKEARPFIALNQNVIIQTHTNTK